MQTIDYAKILKEIRAELNFDAAKGKVASYIPELAHIDPHKFGMHIHCIDGQDFSIGDSREKFSSQSISKVFTMSLAMKCVGTKIWKRMDVEPSGNPFNSLIQLEQENGIPRNPLINSGAIVVADILVTHFKNPKGELRDFVRHIAGDTNIDYNYAVADSEKKSGFRNRALANMLRSFKNIENDVDEVLDFYFHQCSLELSCEQLSKAFRIYANAGVLPDSKERVLSKLHNRRVNALMQTCGFYDEAGEFSFLVGLPGKSGVGGGIAAVHPHQYTVAVWSPRLNEQGNSVLGMKTLELLTTKTGMTIF